MRALGDAGHADRDGHRLRPPAGPHRGEVVADLPVGILVDDCPLYDLEPERSRPGRALPAGPPPCSEWRRPDDETLLALLASANIASRRPVFEQYDPVVQSRTVRRPDEADAAVLAAAHRRGDRRLDRRQRAPRRLRPARGRDRGRLRVRGQPRLRRRRAAGAHQLPELRQPREAPRGVAADRGRGGDRRRPARRSTSPSSAATSRSTTRRPTGPIFPTPVIGMVGRLPDPARAGRLGFAVEGDAIAARRRLRPSRGRLRAGQAPRRAARRATALLDLAAGPRGARDRAASGQRRRAAQRP